VNVGRNFSFEKDGIWRKIVISLNRDDLLRLVADKKVEGYRVELVGEAKMLAVLDDQNEAMPVAEQFTVLNAYADYLGLRQMALEGGATNEYVLEQINGIRQRAPRLRF
jgi:hypothetical protein